MCRTWLRCSPTYGIDGIWCALWEIYPTFVTIVNMFIQYAHGCSGTYVSECSERAIASNGMRNRCVSSGENGVTLRLSVQILGYFSLSIVTLGIGCDPTFGYHLPREDRGRAIILL
jgi:hypothetical protein